MTTTLMAAATCAAKCCPPHAIAAVAGAFVIGVLVGRLTKKGAGKCSCGKGANKARAGHAGHAAAPGGEVTRAPIPAGSVEIYVGNLSYEMGEEDLRKMFGEYGTVSTARIVLNRFNNKSKGFGFVVMPNRSEAEKAIAELSEKEIMGRKMRVNEAKNTIKE